MDENLKAMIQGMVQEALASKPTEAKPAATETPPAPPSLMDQLRQLKEASDLIKEMTAIPGTPRATPGHDPSPRNRDTLALNELDVDDIARLKSQNKLLEKAEEYRSAMGGEYHLFSGKRKQQRRAK